MNLYAYAGNVPVNFSDPFGLKADTNITFNTMGGVESRSGTDATNNYFLDLDGSHVKLDYPLMHGNAPYQIHSDPNDATEKAQELAAEAPVYSNRFSIAVHSVFSGGTVDFKRTLPDRSLWNIGGGMFGHKHVVAKMAWGNDLARRGYSLGQSLAGARLQGAVATGGDDSLDQPMIARRYQLYRHP